MKYILNTIHVNFNYTAKILVDLVCLAFLDIFLSMQLIGCIP